MATITLDLRAWEGDRTASWDVVVSSGRAERWLEPRHEDGEAAEDRAVGLAKRFAAAGHEVRLTETDESGTKMLRIYMPDGTVMKAV